MRPKDLLVKRVEEFLLAPMEEKGFRFAKSQRMFKRKIGPFTQGIGLDLSSWSEADSCLFDVIFEVTVRQYARWYQEMWGEPLPGDWIWARNAWAIPDWPTKPRKRSGFFWTSKSMPLARIHLTNSPEDEMQMTVLRDALLGPALDHFETVTSWEGAADAASGEPHQAGMASDLYMIAGKDDKARRVIDDTIRKMAASNDMNKERIIADLEERRGRCFPTA